MFKNIEKAVEDWNEEGSYMSYPDEAYIILDAQDHKVYTSTYCWVTGQLSEEIDLIHFAFMHQLLPREQWTIKYTATKNTRHVPDIPVTVEMVEQWAEAAQAEYDRKWAELLKPDIPSEF